MFIQFLDDEFLRLMILRYIFCFYTMHLHRAFKVGQLIWAWNSFSVLNLATEMLSKCVFRKKRMIFPWLSLPNRIHASREQFLIHCQRKPELHQFWFSLLCDRSIKLALLYQVLIWKLHNLVTRVFLRFGQFFFWLYFEFLLILKGIFLSFDWPLW